MLVCEKYSVTPVQRVSSMMGISGDGDSPSYKIDLVKCECMSHVQQRLGTVI